MTGTELCTRISRIVQDSSYTTADILDMVNEKLAEVSGGIELANGLEKTPPLPNLFVVGNIFTSPTLPYVTMPTTYQRDLVRLIDGNGMRVTIYDTWDEFSNVYPQLTGTGQLSDAAIVGNNLYYQGIESTTIVDASDSISFTASTKTITGTAGDFSDCEAGSIINLSGSTSNNGNKTVVTVATTGASCTVSETVVDEAVGDDVTITLGAKLTAHYYRFPITLVAAAEPEGLSSAHARKILVHGVSAEIYSEIEDGLEGAKVNTKYHEEQYYKALASLVRDIPVTGESFYR